MLYLVLKAKLFYSSINNHKIPQFEVSYAQLFMSINYILFHFI